MPCSSMVRATMPAPYSRQRSRMRRALASPSSKLMEFTRHLPGAVRRAVSITGISVESIMSGSVTWVTARFRNSAMSRASSRPT